MANADNEAVEYVLLDKKAFVKAVHNEAVRLYLLEGRWTGTTAGRSSGLWKVIAMLDNFTSPLNEV
jgi:hypothetical protein